MPSEAARPARVHFDLEIDAEDKPTDRRRWNGGPFPSQEADDALQLAVSAFQKALTDAGFEPIRIGYGVRAEEWDKPRP
jgi:hypothetical protein